MDPTDLETGTPVPDELDLAATASEQPAGGDDEIERLLAGRFFTIANTGTVSAWNTRAQTVFGWSSAGVVGESFVDKLVAAAERGKRQKEIDALLAEGAVPVALHIETRAVNAEGVEFDEHFSIVPIRLHDGYDLNNLLQDIAKQRDGAETSKLRKKHQQVIGIVEAALAGRVEESPSEDAGEDAGRLVGALVIFDGTTAPASTAGGGESPEDDLETARQELDHLRSRLAQAEADSEEARRDAELAREEVEKTRTKLSDIRGSADSEHGRAEELHSELAELREKLEGAETANESLRGELEDAQASGDEVTDKLRRELEETRAARDDAAAKLTEKEGELSELSTKREELASELEAKRDELAEVAARRDELAGKLDTTGADLAEVAAKRGELAEELEAKRAELAEVASRRDELASELDAKEAELTDAAGRSEELAAAVEAKESELGEHEKKSDELSKKLEELDAERERIAEELARRDVELAEARAAADEAKSEADRRQKRVDELAEALQQAQRAAEDAAAKAEEARSERDEMHARVEETLKELEAARAELDGAAADTETAKAELETAKSSAEEARLQAKGAIGELDEARHQVELFRGAFDTAPIGMALTAPDGRFVKVNRALCDTFGYSEQALLADDPPSIVHPDEVAANREMARQLLAGEIQSSRTERRYVHADGHEIHMRESVALVRDGDETPLLFIFQLEDATEQIELDAAAEARGLRSGADNLPVPLGGEHGTDPAVQGPFLSPERVRQALDEDQFVLYCQPVLDLRSNEVSQYELLIRMIDDDGRLILPQAFLKPAEQAGLIRSIDHWVVRRAIKLIAENRQAGRDVNIEVNVSPESLVDRELLEVIDQELTAHPIDPANLIVEVTESAAAANPEGAAALAKGVRGLGARFALDDFGSTFGSFRHLKDLALDFLKIDGDLVSSLTESRTSQLVVKALVDVARGTGTETIAVFVSDDETLQLLRQHGVGMAQGYVVGRPQPLSEVFADGRAALPPAG